MKQKWRRSFSFAAIFVYIRIGDGLKLLQAVLVPYDSGTSAWNICDNERLCSQEVASSYSSDASHSSDATGLSNDGTVVVPQVKILRLLKIIRTREFPLMLYSNCLILVQNLYV